MVRESGEEVNTKRKKKKRVISEVKSGDRKWAMNDVIRLRAEQVKP